MWRGSAAVCVLVACVQPSPEPVTEDSSTHEAGIWDEFEQMPDREGRAEGARENSPGERRLLLADSSDGLNFQRLGEGVLDQTNHPNALRVHGAVLVYSTAHSVRNERDGTVVSILPAGSDQWSHYALLVDEMPDDGAMPVESYPVLLEDGRIRLYFAAGVHGEWTIYSAVSANGVRFTYEGPVLPGNGHFGHDGGYVDPLVACLDGVWHLLVYDTGNLVTGHARSADGLGFEIDRTIETSSPGGPTVMASFLPIDGGLRVFASLTEGSVASYWTDDGESLNAEDGLRLEPEPGATEGEWVRHASVVPDGDGGWLMIYMTEIPE